MDMDITVGTTGQRKVAFEDIEVGQVFCGAEPETQDNYHYAMEKVDIGTWLMLVFDGAKFAGTEFFDVRKMETLRQAGDPDFRMEKSIMIRMLHRGSMALQREKSEERSQLVGQVETLQHEITRNAQEIRSWQDWRDTLETDAHEMADDNNLCETFDNFMEDHGMNRRMRDFSATLVLEIPVSVTVRAHNEAEAEEIFEHGLQRMDENSITEEVIDELESSVDSANVHVTAQMFSPSVDEIEQV